MEEMSDGANTGQAADGQSKCDRLSMGSESLV